MNRKSSKILGVFLILTLVCTSVISFAESNSVISADEQKKEEINNLYQRAKLGVSDKEVEGLSKAIFTDKETGEIIEKETISTTQLLDTIEVDGKTEKIYRTIVFLDSGNSLNGKSIDTLSLDYNPNAISKPDPSYGVIAYIDVDWRELTINGEAYLKMNEVEVWWDRQDTTINISNRRVLMSQKGYDSNWNNRSSQEKTYYPTSNSAIYRNPYPSSWEPVQDNRSSDVGANTNCVLKRGNSEWELFLNFRIW